MDITKETSSFSKTKIVLIIGLYLGTCYKIE